MTKRCLLALVMVALAAPASAATKVRILGEGRYLLIHRSGMSSAAAGARGYEKSLDKAAALCHLEGFRLFTMEPENQQKHWGGAFGQTGEMTSGVFCFNEGAPAGALEAEPLLLPKTITQMQRALEGADRNAEKRAAKRASGYP